MSNEENQREITLGGNFRGEDLSRAELRELTVLSDREREIVSALEAGGQRLLIGPRGSGKSTYLKIAYYQALDEGKTLPVYVNYARSITLEPEFRRSAAALALFRQWVLAQIVVGVRRTFTDLGLPFPSEYEEVAISSSLLVSAIERQKVESAPELALDLSAVLELLENCAKNAGRRRVILLLDDAAHAFAPEQQREFFEIFAGLRSRLVSSKAAVYPGVTSYTPRFHVGHDAQLIDVWLRPEQEGYLEMMREIARKRLPAEAFESISRREGLIDYLALASFGIPRTMIVMLAQLVEVFETKPLRSNVILADEAIVEAGENALKIFMSLEAKLPRYKNFVEVGRQLVDRSIDALKEYNDRRPEAQSNDRATRILLEEPVPAEIQRIIGFLEYAGVVRQQVGSLSNGGRSYKVVTPHYGLLVARGAIGLGRNPSTAGAVEALTSRQHTVRVRRTLSSLLGEGYVDRCRLDLGACARCGAERENAEARFCSTCGNALAQASVYDELLGSSVEKLPISDVLLTRIRDHSNVRQIKDILLDEENLALLEIPYIAAIRAARIRALSEEYVYE